MLVGCSSSSFFLGGGVLSPFGEKPKRLSNVLSLGVLRGHQAFGRLLPLIRLLHCSFGYQLVLKRTQPGQKEANMYGKIFI